MESTRPRQPDTGVGERAGMTTAAVTSVGRPRAEGFREDEILEAALDVLVQVGYDKLSFDLVAAQAKASKATLYRKWPTKADLVSAAVAKMKDHSLRPEPPDTGRLESDLIALSCDDTPLTMRMIAVMGAILPALHRDAELFARFERDFLEPHRAVFREVLERARQRGEVDPQVDLDLLTGILPGMAINYTVEHASMPSADFMARVVRQVILPSARGTLG